MIGLVPLSQSYACSTICHLASGAPSPCFFISDFASFFPQKCVLFGKADGNHLVFTFRDASCTHTSTPEHATQASVAFHPSTPAKSSPSRRRAITVCSPFQTSHGCSVSLHRETLNAFFFFLLFLRNEEQRPRKQKDKGKKKNSRTRRAMASSSAVNAAVSLGSRPARPQRTLRARHVAQTTVSSNYFFTKEHHARAILIPLPPSFPKKDFPVSSHHPPPEPKRPLVPISTRAVLRRLSDAALIRFSRQKLSPHASFPTLVMRLKSRIDIDDRRAAAPSAFRPATPKGRRVQKALS